MCMRATKALHIPSSKVDEDEWTEESSVPEEFSELGGLRQEDDGFARAAAESPNELLSASPRDEKD